MINGTLYKMNVTEISAGASSLPPSTNRPLSNYTASTGFDILLHGKFPNNTNISQLDLPSVTSKLSATDITAILFLSLIILIGFAGNCIVIYVFGIKPGKSRKRFETFLLLLGIIDLISSILVPIPFIYLTVTDFQYWHFGEIGCKIIPSLLQISIFVSQGVLMLICYERYQTIVYPFNRRLRAYQVLLWLLFVFVAAILFSIPYIKTFKVVRDDMYNINTCVPGMGSNKTLLISAVIYLCRDIASAFILILLSYKIRASLIDEPEDINWNRSKMSEKGRRLLIIVIVVFLILTLPADIYRVIIYALFELDTHISNETYRIVVTFNTFLNILQISNSICNVFIYSRVHSNFSSLFKSILKKHGILEVNMKTTVGERGNEDSCFLSTFPYEEQDENSNSSL